MEPTVGILLCHQVVAKGATASFSLLFFSFSGHTDVISHIGVCLFVFFCDPYFEKCDCSALFISVLYRTAQYFSTGATLSCSFQILVFFCFFFSNFLRADMFTQSARQRAGLGRKQYVFFLSWDYISSRNDWQTVAVSVWLTLVTWLPWRHWIICLLRTSALILKLCYTS